MMPRDITKPFVLVALLLVSTVVCAQENKFKDAWKLADLYENEQGDYLKLSGRLQADAAWFDSSQGNYSDIRWRRFRFGIRAKYGRTQLGLEASSDLNNALGDAYSRLTDAYLRWRFDNGARLTVLKHSAGFTLDGRTSSKKLITPQRNNLTNNLWFTAEYFNGISMQGNLDQDWSYTAAVFSSDGDDELGFSDASYFTLLSVRTSLGSTKLWQEGELTLDYVYNEVHERDNTRDFSQVLSLSGKFNSGDWHLWADIALAQGDLSQSDIRGLSIMPYYQQTGSVQWVMRYTWLDSDDPNGLRLGRYENEIVEGLGDHYQEFFGGVNYLFNEHKFKLQLGAQYTQMSDSAGDGGQYDGWGLTLALRTYW